jgi:Tir chaperone protein (CesT) family
MKATHFSPASRTSHASQAVIYKDLMKACFSLYGKTDEQNIAENKNEIFVENIPLSLLYLPKINSQALHVSANVLQIKSGQEVTIYPKILSSNFYLHARTSPVLALSPTTPTVLAIMCLSLKQMTPSLLDQILKNMANAVIQWQNDLLE